MSHSDVLLQRSLKFLLSSSFISEGVEVHTAGLFVLTVLYLFLLVTWLGCTLL